MSTSTYTKTNRLLLERQLIGRAITCIPSALTLCDVLTEANFQDPLCQKVFPLLLKGLEKLELGLINITRLYTETYSEKAAYQITELTAAAESYPTVLELALRLLEDDMRDKFLQLLRLKEQAAVKDSDFEAAGVWKQCADHLADQANDVFTAIDHLHQYLSACFPKESMEQYNHLRGAIPKMIQRIKERKNTRKFMDTLTMLASVELSPEANRTIQILKDWMILTMAGLKTPDKFHETIHQLNHTWHE